jgi:hypothetical protein
MTTRDERAGCEPPGYVPTGPLHSKEELERFKPPMTTDGVLTGYENTGPLFSKEELEQRKPPRKRRKMDWATAATVGTSLGIALAIVAAGAAWGAAEGYSPGRIVREIVHGSPKVRTVTRPRTGTAAGPVDVQSPVTSFAPGLPVMRQVTVAPRPAMTVTAPPKTAAAPAPARPKAKPRAAPTTAPPTTVPPTPAPTTVLPQPVPTTAAPTPVPTINASTTAVPTASASP